MSKFIPLCKQSKRNQREANKTKRILWTTDPRTKIVPNKRHYSRKNKEVLL